MRCLPCWLVGWVAGSCLLLLLLLLVLMLMPSREFERKRHPPVIRCLSGPLKLNLVHAQITP